MHAHRGMAAVALLAGCLGGEPTDLGQVSRVLDIAPAVVDFGGTSVGSEQQQTATLVNRGQGIVHVRGVNVVGDPAFAASVEAGALAAGDSRRVTVTFRPGSRGSHAAQLTVDSDADPGAVELRGTAQDLDCADDNPCTQDDADPATHACLHVPVAGPCDDGNACTQADTCQDGRCLGQRVSCDDHVECTVDACDPQTGCQSTPLNARCEDQDPCTVDRCDALQGCIHEAVPDGSACGETLECVEMRLCFAGRCQAFPVSDGFPCASACNGACSGGFCRADAVRPPSPADGICGEVCGNGVVDSCPVDDGSDAECRPADLQEECDGETSGGITCSSVGFASGSMECRADCRWDLRRCSACLHNPAVAACQELPVDRIVYDLAVANRGPDVALAWLSGKPWEDQQLRITRLGPDLRPLFDPPCLPMDSADALVMAGTSTGWLLVLASQDWYLEHTTPVRVLALDAGAMPRAPAQTLDVEWRHELMLVPGPAGASLLLGRSDDNAVGGALLRDDGSVAWSQSLGGVEYTRDGQGWYHGRSATAAGDRFVVVGTLGNELRGLVLGLDGTREEFSAALASHMDNAVVAWNGSALRVVWANYDPLEPGMRTAQLDLPWQQRGPSQQVNPETMQAALVPFPDGKWLMLPAGTADMQVLDAQGVPRVAPFPLFRTPQPRTRRWTESPLGPVVAHVEDWGQRIEVARIRPDLPLEPEPVPPDVCAAPPLWQAPSCPGQCGNNSIDHCRGTEHWECDVPVDRQELCDGTNLDGQTCQSLGYGGGELGCAAWCGWDVHGCSACGARPEVQACTSHRVFRGASFSLAGREDGLAAAWISNGRVHFTLVPADLRVEEPGCLFTSWAPFTQVSLVGTASGWLLAGVVAEWTYDASLVVQALAPDGTPLSSIPSLAMDLFGHREFQLVRGPPGATLLLKDDEGPNHAVILDDYAGVMATADLGSYPPWLRGVGTSRGFIVAGPSVGPALRALGLDGTVSAYTVVLWERESFVLLERPPGARMVGQRTWMDLDAWAVPVAVGTGTGMAPVAAAAVGERVIGVDASTVPPVLVVQDAAGAFTRVPDVIADPATTRDWQVVVDGDTVVVGWLEDGWSTGNQDPWTPPYPRSSDATELRLLRLAVP